MNPLFLGFCLALGGVAGVLHVATLRRNVRLFTAGGSLLLALALQLLRLGLLAVPLVLVARHGALPVLMATLGLLGSRAIAVRRYARRAA